MGKDPALKITVGRDVALHCQQLLNDQGVPLNVTQAVNAMLNFAIQIKTTDATKMAQGNNYGSQRQR